MKIRASVAAAGVGLTLALGGCSETVAGSPEPLAASPNLLDARLQLEQVIRFSGSIISCMLLDETTGAYVDEYGALSNAKNSDGPDHAPNTQDDGPQPVYLIASIDGGGAGTTPFLNLSAMNTRNQPQRSITILNDLDPAAENAWRRGGTMPDLMLDSLRDMTRPDVWLWQTGDVGITTITMGDEGQTPIVTIPSPGQSEYEIKHTDKPLTRELAGQYSAAIHRVTMELLHESGVQSCNLS